MRRRFFDGEKSPSWPFSWLVAAFFVATKIACEIRATKIFWSKLTGGGQTDVSACSTYSWTLSSTLFKDFDNIWLIVKFKFFMKIIEKRVTMLTCDGLEMKMASFRVALYRNLWSTKTF